MKKKNIKKTEKKEEINQNLYHPNRYNYDNDFEFSNWLLVPVLILTGLMTFFLAALIFILFMCAASLFIIPIYFAITTKMYALILLELISAPLGVWVLREVYQMLIEEEEEKEDRHRYGCRL